jgi:hypothetical protein
LRKTGISVAEVTGERFKGEGGSQTLNCGLRAVPMEMMEA